MNVRVEENRFLSVACEPDERIVFDRKETRYHLLRDSAARLWDEICEGGTFEVAATPGEGQNPVVLLAEAGLVGIEDDTLPSEGITRRVWLSRTGKVSAAAVVLPLVASISTPRLVLGQEPSLEEETADLVEQTNSDPLSDPLNRTRQRTRGPETGTSGSTGSGSTTGTGTGQESSSETTTSGTRTRNRDR
jgi:hypothetical protein